jgi:hypothetical protein
LGAMSTHALPVAICFFPLRRPVCCYFAAVF